MPVIDAAVFTPRSSFYIPASKLDHEKILEMQEHEDILLHSDDEIDSDDDFYLVELEELRKKTEFEHVVEPKQSVKPQLNKQIQRKETFDSPNVGYSKTIKTIFTKYLFVSSMLTISVLYFVVTGIQFWISDYCRSVLGAPKIQVF